MTNGSYLFEEFMSEQCKSTDFTKANPAQCSGIEVFQSKGFFPLNDSDSFKFFEKKFRREVLERLNNTVTVHLNDRLSETRIMGKGDAYDVIARTCCPHTYKAHKGKPF